jgi:hypothetical protein
MAPIANLRAQVDLADHIQLLAERSERDGRPTAAAGALP